MPHGHISWRQMSGSSGVPGYLDVIERLRRRRRRIPEPCTSVVPTEDTTGLRRTSKRCCRGTNDMAGRPSDPPAPTGLPVGLWVVGAPR